MEEEWLTDWVFEGVTEDDLAGRPPFHTIHYRRTLTWWVNALAAAGLQIEFLDEPYPGQATVDHHPSIAGSRIIPYFLIVRCRKLSCNKAAETFMAAPTEVDANVIQQFYTGNSYDNKT